MHTQPSAVSTTNKINKNSNKTKPKKKKKEKKINNQPTHSHIPALTCYTCYTNMLYMLYRLPVSVLVPSFLPVVTAGPLDFCCSAGTTDASQLPKEARTDVLPLTPPQWIIQTEPANPEISCIEFVWFPHECLTQNAHRSMSKLPEDGYTTTTRAFSA